MQLVALPKLSNDAILEVITWSAVAAALVPLAHAVLREKSGPQSSSRHSLQARKGPLDRFRTAGAFVLAVLVAAFAYTFSDDPAAAIPGLHTGDSLWIWTIGNVASLVAFAALANDEARRGRPESSALRLFWVLEAASWGVVVVVRLDKLAADGLAEHPADAPSLCFYGLFLGALGVGGSYALFNAQDRFPAKRRPAPLRLPQGVAAAVDAYEPVLGGDGDCDGGGAFRKASPSLLDRGSLGASLLADDAATDGPLAAYNGWRGPRGGEAALPVDQRECPEVYAGPLSIAYFAWVTPLVNLGFKRPLEQADLAKLHPSDDPTRLNAALQAAWAAEVNRAGAGGRPSLFRALASAFGFDYAVGALCKFVYDGQQFVGPLLLQRLITFLSDYNTGGGDEPPVRVGYELVALLAINAFSQSIVLHMYFHRAFRTGLRLKAATIAALYDKSLKVKSGAAEMTKEAAAALDGAKGRDKSKGRTKEEAKEALSSSSAAAAAADEAVAEADIRTKKKTTGEVVNLMAVDAQRLQDTMSYIAMLWSGLFQISVSLWFLFSLLGPSVFAGVGIMLLSLPATSKLSVLSRQRQKRVMNIKDGRIKVENEVLGGMKIIKLYAWEAPFISKVDMIRDRELAALWDYQCLQMGSRVLWAAVPTLVSIASFAAFTLSGNELTAATAFTSLALFNLLRFPLASLPWAIASVVECTLSLARIQSFLLSPEVRPLPPLPSDAGASRGMRGGISDGGAQADAGDGGYEVGNPLAYAPPPAPPAAGAGASGLAASSAAAMRPPPRLELENARFEWDDGTPLLQGVSLSVADGELCCMCGPTGSGKSGLLSAIIGELEPVEGTIASRGAIAYVSQVAWIQNATLKDNVLFGKPLDAARYAEVVDACALRADLEQLPDGDATEIGEKGINLSGGQKQRVAIARAVYANADVYLLDDCLSAVDSEVAQHIFWKCIKAPRLLASKAVLLVTHNLQLLPHADAVVLLDGKACPYAGPCDGFLQQPHELARRLRESREASAAVATGEKALARSASKEALAGLAAAPTAAAAVATAATTTTTTVTTVTTAAATAAAARAARKDKGSDGTGKKGSGKGDKNGKGLIESEAMERGAVSLETYRLYVEACGNWSVLLGVFGGLLLNNCISAGASWWLGYWADHSSDAVDDDGGGDSGGVVSAGLGLGLYSGLSAGAIGASFCAIISATTSGQRACRRFHKRLLRGVCRAPMAFFDTTPLGRVLNRFSKDVYTLDEQLPNTMYSWLSTALACIIAISAVAFVVPWFLAACVPMGYVYYRVMVVYVPTSRELQRLESVTRSPVFSHFGETLEGASTIRAFRAESMFTSCSMGKLERNLRSYYFNVSSNRWLALRLEAIGTCFVTLAALLAVAEAGSVSGGAGGLALTYALNITQTLNWYVRVSSDRESQVVAVERCQEYATLESEAAPVIEGRQPPLGWPQRGAITLKRVTMRYRPGLPLVLRGASGHGLDLAIPAMQKVGIVGRTGSGKSSLLLVLLRLVEPEPGAKLLIDGEDALAMGLDDLRKRISIIPQDPVKIRQI